MTFVGIRVLVCWGIFLIKNRVSAVNDIRESMLFSCLLLAVIEFNFPDEYFFELNTKTRRTCFSCIDHTWCLFILFVSSKNSFLCHIISHLQRFSQENDAWFIFKSTWTQPFLVSDISLSCLYQTKYRECPPLPPPPSV
jgi:hypothetical protein